MFQALIPVSTNVQGSCGTLPAFKGCQTEEQLWRPGIDGTVMQAAEKLAEDLRQAVHLSRAQPSLSPASLPSAAHPSGVPPSPAASNAQQLLEVAQATGRAHAAEHELSIAHETAERAALGEHASATLSHENMKAALEQNLQARPYLSFSVTGPRLLSSGCAIQ
jgi:hypothetical protein